MRGTLGEGTPLDWALSPADALRRWPADRRIALLHSGRFHPRWATRSLLAEPAGVFRFHGTPETGGRSAWSGPPGVVGGEPFSHQPFRDLRRVLAAAEGPWIGYLSYDLGRWVERLPAPARADREWPVIELAWCPGYLVADAETGRWRACGAWRDGGAPEVPALPPRAAVYRADGLRGVFTRAEYEASVARVLGYIAAGDAFQVNLAQRFTADFFGAYPLAARALYARLAEISPAWYGAYLEGGGETDGPRRAVLSTSPELFLEVDEAGRVVTRPIKGTRPAAADPDALRASGKDAAELHMIVDLLRNDLGRVCGYGSVKVPEPRAIESHPTVHHGVATVTGRLHPSKGLTDLLRATMPGGSVTGAPKVRAMEIIDELEPVRRGPYCGAIGWFSGRAMALNLAIRTLLVERHGDAGEATGGRVDFSVGGGIVAESRPATEYEETLDKAAAMLAALGLTRADAEGMTGE